MLKKLILLAAGVFFLWGTVSCGTLIYPQRRGQTDGRIDPAVAILDGVGLLVFIIPGLVAYAIDFSTGAIYLPSSRGGGAEAEAGVKFFQAKSRKWDDIAAVVKQLTGRRLDLADPALRIYRPDRMDPDFGAELAALAAGQPVAPTWTACSISSDGTLIMAGSRVALLRE